MFEPGNIIPESAPYLVRHAEHRPEHAVNANAGDVFLNCKICGDAVRYVKLNSEMFSARAVLNDDPGFTRENLTVRIR